MDDLISRQAAIDAVCAVCGNDCDKSKFIYDVPQTEQVIMCPEHYALSTLPLAQPDVPDTNVGNTISRQATYLALVEKGQASKRYKLGETWELNGKEIREALDALPSVQPEPERMRAKWIVTTSLQEGQITWRDYKCSNCSHHREKPMNFCEVCGAKMER